MRFLWYFNFTTVYHYHDSAASACSHICFLSLNFFCLLREIITDSLNQPKGQDPGIILFVETQSHGVPHLHHLVWNDPVVNFCANSCTLSSPPIYHKMCGPRRLSDLWWNSSKSWVAIPFFCFNGWKIYIIWYPVQSWVSICNKENCSISIQDSILYCKKGEQLQFLIFIYHCPCWKDRLSNTSLRLINNISAMLCNITYRNI